MSNPRFNRKVDYEFQKPRMPSGTTSMKSNYVERSNEKLHTVENKYKPKATFDNPVMPQMKLVNPNLKTDKFSSFVSQYARVHGYNYKDALKDPNIKKIYKLHNNRAVDSDYLVKQTYEKPRVQFVGDTYKNVGTEKYIDTRANIDIYSPVDIQQVSLDQQNLQIARGFNVELKNAYLKSLGSRGSIEMNTFIDNGFTSASLAPINDGLIRAIINDIIKGKSKNIYEISPFMELGITLSSLSSLQGQLGERKLIEYPKNTISERIAKRLKGPVLIDTGFSVSQTYDNIQGCDTFFLNVASDSSAVDYLETIINNKNDGSKSPYDIYLSDTRKFSTISDFYKTKVGTNLVQKLMPNLSQKELTDLLTSLRGSKTEISVDVNEETLRNFDKIFSKYVGDQRNVIKEIESQNLQGSKRFDDLNEALSKPVVKKEEVDVKLDPTVKQEPPEVKQEPPEVKPDESKDKDEEPKRKGPDYNETTNGGTIYYRIINSNLLPIQKGCLIKTSKNIKNKIIYQFNDFELKDDNAKLYFINPQNEVELLKGPSKKLTSFKRIIITNNAIENNRDLKRDLNKISTLRSMTLKDLTASPITTQLFNEIRKVSSGVSNNVDYGAEYAIEAEFPDIPVEEGFTFVPAIKKEEQQEPTVEPTFEPVPPTPSSDSNLPSNIPPIEGQGMLGAGLTEDISSFKTIFDPKMTFIGKSGIVNIYKLSM